MGIQWITWHDDMDKQNTYVSCWRGHYNCMASGFLLCVTVHCLVRQLAC